VSEERVRDKMAAYVGVSGRTLERAAVVAAVVRAHAWRVATTPGARATVLDRTDACKVRIRCRAAPLRRLLQHPTTAGE
jgi:hypothetical protein